MIQLSNSKKVYDYLRYVYNLTGEKHVIQNGLNLAGYCGSLGLDGIYFDLVKKNYLDSNDGKVMWITSEPSIKMANALIEEVKKQNKKPKTKYKKWTEKEILKMEELKNQGYKLEEIAKILKRSLSSVQNKNKKQPDIEMGIVEGLKDTAKRMKDIIKQENNIDFNQFVYTDIEEENEKHKKEIYSLKKEISCITDDLKYKESVIDRFVPIKSEEDLTKGLERISELMNNTSNIFEERELEILGVLVNDYEEENHPIPDLRIENNYLLYIPKIFVKVLVSLIVCFGLILVGYFLNVILAI